MGPDVPHGRSIARRLDSDIVRPAARRMMTRGSLFERSDCGRTNRLHDLFLTFSQDSRSWVSCSRAGACGWCWGVLSWWGMAIPKASRGATKVIDPGAARTAREMKALTLSQPWAWAIIYGGKDIENRTWRTRYRGPLAINAGMARGRNITLPSCVPKPPEELGRGAIIGVVDLVDVVEHSQSKWFGGPYGWVLRSPRPLTKPIPCRGRLGVWKLSPEQLRLIQRRLE